MSIYRPEMRVLEVEADDEPSLRHHFANARRAWREQREIADASYHYRPDAQGVWGFSPGVPKSDYFWPKAVLGGRP
ncbi:MAG: hypothetical protein HY680_04385 [Chloroflexi bacterium]|nr:hypothetical protein [Chloroflexota bacterium]